MNKVVLVTGASAGIGKETARLLAQNEYTVYGAARRVEKMDELKSVSVQPLYMDVTDDESMVTGVQQILEEAGRIDILVNSAGFGSHGAIEDVSMDDARYQLEVNVIGAMRLVQLVLPGMRKNRFGKIVNVSSVGGKIAGPLAGWYHASKFALEGLSDSLRNEIKPFGIDVIVIQPGAIATEWGDIAHENLLKASGDGPYKKMAEKLVDVIQNSTGNRTDPVVIAELIKTSVEAKNPKTRYVKGHLSTPILFVNKITSDKVMDKILASQFS
ncbi:oxidoreductase [Rhodohalobacter sp. 614A]|uniref:oxidoreductase n=1 Tax=Rhodohalobacter sp. 614A TaxID=2908649 RepID=UPI001F17196E|nr:oxidoreductase [Rhodohalobacter sp. 614A]